MNTFIIDVSSWNADRNTTTNVYTVKLNPQQMIDTGCIGAIIRLNSGTWLDPAAEQFVTQLSIGNIPIGAYYYNKPDELIGEIYKPTDPIKIATVFSNRVKQLGGLDAFKLGFYCDAPEKIGGAVYTEHTFKSIETVISLLSPDMRKVGIYTNKNFWRSNSGERPEYVNKAMTYQLWCALWNNAPGTIPVAPIDYYPNPWKVFNKWLFHQYSADNNRMARIIGVMSGDPDIDLSIFNPMLGKFESYFGIVKPIPIDPILPIPTVPSPDYENHEQRIKDLEDWKNKPL